MDYLDHNKIKEEAEAQIDLSESSQDRFEDDICDPGMNRPSEACRGMMEFCNDKCYLDQAHNAQLRLKSLKSLGFLTENFRSPLTAAAGSSLKGPAQETCVYDEK